MGAEQDDDVTPREMKSLAKLASANFSRFAIQVQHVSTEVQMKIIEQLPEFTKLAADAIEKISKAHETTLDSVQHAEDHAHEGIREWRAALIAMLDDVDLSLDDKLKITAQIGETVTAQTAFIAENNKAKAMLFVKTVLGVVGVVGLIVVAVTGGKFAIDQASDEA